jgi:predicted DNA-binding antitoxin AbrB/MazE fold protein
MKGLEIEAVYENGALKLPRELPLREGQKVTITIHPPGGVVGRASGQYQSNLSPGELEALLGPDHAASCMLSTVVRCVTSKTS